MRFRDFLNEKEDDLITFEKDPKRGYILNARDSETVIVLGDKNRDEPIGTMTVLGKKGNFSTSGNFASKKLKRMFTDKEYKILKKLFLTLNKDNDGKLTISDFANNPSL